MMRYTAHQWPESTSWYVWDEDLEQYVKPRWLSPMAAKAMANIRNLESERSLAVYDRSSLSPGDM